MKNRSEEDWGGSMETSRETFAVIQGRDNGGLVQRDNGNEKWSDFGCILKVDLTNLLME